jgi:hypothetical protein
MTRSVWICLLSASLSLVLVACSAATDRDRYEMGEAGTTTFENGLDHPVYLEGCSAWAFERSGADGWQGAGPGVVCIWEGFAQPVAPQSSVSFAFSAPSLAGRYRLRYLAGIGCDPAQPMSRAHCLDLAPVFSEPFDVAGEICGAEEPGCRPMPALPSYLCEDGIHTGGLGECRRDAETGACGWEILSCPEDQG